MSIVDGSKEAHSPLTKAYGDRVNLALSEIVTKLDDANTSHVFEHVLEPKAMWAALTLLHTSSSPANKAKIFGQFYGLSCPTSGDLKTFLGDVRLVDQQLTRIGFKLDSEVLAYFNLFKLPSELESVRSALLFGGKDVTLKYVLDSLDQTSSTTSVSVVVKSESALVAAADANRPRCTHCKRVGHLVETCYRLHPHLNPRKPAPPSTSASVAEQVFMASTGDNQPSLTILDSGTTSHMFNNISLVNSLKVARSRSASVNRAVL